MQGSYKAACSFFLCLCPHSPVKHLQWYVLALSSTFAGNLITIGSIANLITFEQASVYGVKVGFWEHAKVGIPVTLVSFGIAVGRMMFFS